MVQRLAEGAAEHGADEQAGGEDAAGSADADGQAGGDHLADQQYEQEPDGVAAGDAVTEDGVADAVHLRQEQQQPAEQQPADGGAQPFRAAPGPVAGVLDEVEHAGEDHADQAGEQAEAAKSRYSPALCTAKAGRCRNGSLPSAARPMTLAVTEASTTMPKDCAAKSRRISSIAKNTPASGALKVAAMPPAAPQATSTRMPRSATRTSCRRGAERGADLHDRALPPHRSAAADAQRRGQGLDAATWGAIRPPRRATAYITSGTPCPRASRAKKCTSGP